MKVITTKNIEINNGLRNSIIIPKNVTFEAIDYRHLPKHVTEFWGPERFKRCENREFVVIYYRGFFIGVDKRYIEIPKYIGWSANI